MTCWNIIFNKNAILEEIAENFNMDAYIQRWEDETYNEINGWGDIETRQLLECVYDMFRSNYTWDDISYKLMYECNDEMCYLLLNINEFNRENGLADAEVTANYREEMDRINAQDLINGADPMSVPLPEDPLTEEQVLEQLIRQQYRVVDIGRE